VHHSCATPGSPSRGKDSHQPMQGYHYPCWKDVSGDHQRLSAYSSGPSGVIYLPSLFDAFVTRHSLWGGQFSLQLSVLQVVWLQIRILTILQCQCMHVSNARNQQQRRAALRKRGKLLTQNHHGSVSYYAQRKSMSTHSCCRYWKSGIYVLRQPGSMLAALPRPWSLTICTAGDFWAHTYLQRPGGNDLLQWGTNRCASRGFGKVGLPKSSHREYSLWTDYLNIKHSGSPEEEGGGAGLCKLIVGSCNAVFSSACRSEQTSLITMHVL